jgi:hypothetical protein
LESHSFAHRRPADPRCPWIWRTTFSRHLPDGFGEDEHRCGRPAVISLNGSGCRFDGFRADGIKKPAESASVARARVFKASEMDVSKGNRHQFHVGRPRWVVPGRSRSGACVGLCGRQLREYKPRSRTGSPAVSTTRSAGTVSAPVTTGETACPDVPDPHPLNRDPALRSGNPLMALHVVHRVELRLTRQPDGRRG